MFRLQRLEISGFKSFADYTEIVFTGSGITAVVGPNGCGKSNVSDAISWVLGEQRAKSLRGGEMKDVVFAGTRDRKPGGMAEVVLHLVRDDSVAISDEPELEDIDEALTGIDEAAVDMDLIEGVTAEDAVEDAVSEEIVPADGEEPAVGDVETVKAAQVGSAQVVETRVKTKRHWRPRSFALDFAPGEAVSVTRRLYLSGESEYLLNGKACRLRDISDLFAGTGLSGSHYAIIEQGRIGQILSAKPTDRRNLIEEAAGISKFRTRQRAAETRLDSAKSNLSRITDIVSEVDTRVNSLRRQAAKTRRFKILQEEFRVLLRQLYAAEGKHFTELSATLEAQHAQAVGEENALRTQLTKGEEGAREATQAARRAEESLAELRKIHSDNALSRDRAEREHVYKSEQVVALNDRIASLNGEIEAGTIRLESIAADFERLTAEDREQLTELEAAEGELRTADEAHRGVLSAVTRIEAEIESSRAELIQHTSAAERFDEIGRQLEINLEKVRNRLTGLQAEAGRADQNLKDHETRVAELSANLTAEKAKLESLTNEKNDLLKETGEAREHLREAESSHRGLADEFAAKKHRLDTLSELEEKRAVYAPQVQKLFAASEEIGVEFKGVLADHLKVDETAEKAVEALFGNFLESVVVSSLADAKRVSGWLRANNAGRTALLINSGDAHATVDSPAQNSIESYLGVSPEFAAVLRSAFPNEMSAIVVDDLAGAASFPGSMAVSFAGDILIGGRVLIGGGTQEEGANQSLLAFKRELTILASEVAELSSGIDAAIAAVDSARENLVQLEGKTVDLQSLLIKVDRGIHGLEIQLHAAKEEIDRATRHRKVVGEESEQSTAEIADLEERIADAADNRTSAENARKESAASLETVAASLLAERTALEAANLVLNEKRTAAATSGERRRSVKAALGRVEAQRTDFESRVTNQKTEVLEAEEKLRALHASITEITDKIAAAPDAVAAETTDLNAAIDALALARADADRSSEDLAEINRRTADAMNHRAEIEVRQAEAVTELKNAGENCQQELNIALPDLVASTEIAEDFVLETARSDAESLRERLDGFGALNMLALEELAEAEERQIFLTTQRDDIVQSIAATEEALKEIKHRSRERFRQAFEAINENFQEFFRELFGGGQGQMTLLESDDILEAGIEVVAQPPGKRLQNILLLSGGEKAMTAIALVMAIFKYRPSPFCLLDEVDAPLDEANVGRFVNKIADMAEKTQFIVITHNKRTMEAARALYGVTMQEPGVSKIVSVKFE